MSTRSRLLPMITAGICRFAPIHYGIAENETNEDHSKLLDQDYISGPANIFLKLLRQNSMKIKRKIALVTMMGAITFERKGVIQAERSQIGVTKCRGL